jgi:urease accessory protein UreE
MPSSDHYGQELREQLQRAATQRISHLLVNERDLHSSLRDLTSTNDMMVACRLAMRSEMKAGDVILVTESNAAGMTVRYVLPRAAA